MRLKSNFIFLLGLIVPALIIFKSLIAPGTIAWGDAPHFFSEELRELVVEPQAWTNRGENFAGVDPRLWISPFLLVFGLLGKLGLSNEIIVRLVFYFPALILSFLGPALLAKYLKRPKSVQFVASFIYVFNTYFMLLIDGGQVGVSLAYGLFPFSILLQKKLIDRPGLKIFFSTLAVLFLTFIADPRVGIISLLTVLLWKIIDILSSRSLSDVRSLIKLYFFLGISLAGLNAYWLVPLFNIQQNSGNLEVSKLQLLSLLNPLLLYQPHWPNNIFGQITYPAWYFVGIPILIFSTVFFKKSRKPQKVKDYNSRQSAVLVLIFLLFAFLAKGNTPPLGEFYNWFITSAPFGFAFRDASKFFIPILLVAGLLIGDTVFKVNKKWFSLAVFAYLLILIFPALSSGLNFTLSDRKHSQDLWVIKKNLAEDDGFYRTAWFPERHPLTFETSNKPALDAKKLVDTRIFGRINTGSFDKFNFLHNEEYIKWFRLLGIRYLVLSGDQRNPFPNIEEKELWSDLNKRISTSSALVKKDWTDDIPAYEIKNTNPQMFAVDKLIAVVGPEPYENVNSENSPFTSAYVFFEDGLLNPLDLQGVASDSAKLVFNNRDGDDLAMSFLQKYFKGADETSESDWSIYSPSQYLESKYQLLIRDLDYQDFDYGKAVALSTEVGEEIEFEFDVEAEADYILALRSLSDNEKGSLTFSINDQIGVVEYTREGSFEWYTAGVELDKGRNRFRLINNGGLKAVNIAAIVPNDSWNEAKRMTDVFITHFGITELDELTEGTTTISEVRKVSFDKKYPTWFDIQAPESANWIILTDSYNPDWKLKRGVKYFNSVPAYSMVNAFYIEPEWNKVSIRFIGQESVRWGIYYSVISFLSLSITFLWFYHKKK